MKKNQVRLKPLVKVAKFSFLLCSVWACLPQKPSPGSIAGETSVLKIAVQPNEAQNNFEELSRELETRIGRKVSFVPTKDYSQSVELFRTDQVDFAFFSPMNFIKAEKEGLAKVLLKKIYEGSEFYYSALVVRKDSPIRKVEDLRGKEIALVDPMSVSGYLYPKFLLSKSGVPTDDKSVVMGGTHKAAIEALEAGQVAAAGVWSADAQGHRGAWTDHGQGAAFRVLKVSEPIPNDAFVVRQKLYDSNPEVVLKVMEAFIAVSEIPSYPLKATFGTNRLTTATSRHYDSVRELQKLVEK